MAKHFANEDPLTHVMGKRIEGMISVSEVHGTEMPRHLSAAADAGRETAIVLILFWLFLSLLHIPFPSACAAFVALGLGWVAWKGGRSGWLGWARLERLHRLIEQEKYEIEHHRPQEREELMALYRAKGFEGKLLSDVVDVLMADQNRLLKVMLEEEMGLTLQAYEHPLQQTLGAVIGASLSLGVGGLFLFFFPGYGMWIAAFLLLASASVLSAVYERNRLIAAIIWNVSMGVLALGVSYFLFRMFI
jgi:vacuolar iron transporter family protein